MSATCGCARIGVGLGQAFGRDWRASCPEHGRRSAWYRNGGRAYLEAYAAYSVELQRLAAQARRSGISGVVPPPPRHEDFEQVD